MKIIDLIKKIANGEVVPMKIKYKDDDYVFSIDTKQYYKGDDLKTINTFYENSLRARLYDFEMLNDEVEIIEDKPIEEIRKLQSEIDILTNKVEHYYSEVVSFRDKTRYLKDELKKLKENK